MSQIEGSIENKSCSAIQIDPKKVFEIYTGRLKKNRD